jgi:hypothetical protein
MARFEKGCIPWNKGIKVPRRTEEEKEAIQKVWRDNNRELRNEKNKEWRRANPVKAAVIAKKTRLKNMPRVIASVNKRRADKLNRTSKWLAKDDLWLIKEAYELAALRTKMFGFKWHVDHIIPLKGKLVSGLHVPTNLQVIEGRLNIMKNNKFEGELS